MSAQTTVVIKPENGDCYHPLEIKDTIFGPTTAPSGYGSIMEVSGEKKSLYSFEKEHNTVWYFFKSPGNCELSFDIIPEQLSDDYDFILYRYNGKNFCRDVAENKVIPARTCISRNEPKIGSKTGLSSEAKDEYVHSGPGPSYCKSLKVKKGEIFYLVVDNVYPGGKGHSIRLRYSNCSGTVTPVVKKEEPQPGNNVPQWATIIISVRDKKTANPLSGKISVFKKGQEDTEALMTKDSSGATWQAALAQTYTVKVTAPGYFDFSKEVKTTYHGGTIKVDAELTAIEIGVNVIFEDILFYGNRAEFLPESTPSLRNLYNTLKSNPSLKIEIQGHVNCPSSYDNCDKQADFNNQLSLDRAKAVYDYLVEKGIDPSRLTYAGYGASRMLYPDARSEDKMKKNRRVEVVVLSY